MAMEDMGQMNENRYDDQDQIDILHLIHGAWLSIKRLWIILLCVIVAITGLFTLYKKYTYSPLYETKVTLSVIKKTDPTFYYNVDAAKQVQEVFGQVLKSELLYSVIKDDLNVSYLPGYYSCSAIDETNLLVVRSFSQDQEMSYQLLESLINNYDQVSSLIISDVRLNVIGDIVESTGPNNPFSWATTVCKGLMMALIINGLFIFVDVFLRRTVQKEEDIKKHLNTQCLASISYIPKKKRTKKANQTVLLGVNQLSDSFLEGLRLLRHRIEKDAKKHDNKIYVFSSTVPGEGKSTISSNTAIALSKNDKKVLLIDADLRKPSIAQMFQVTLKGTLNEVLDGTCPLSNAITFYKDGLYLLGNIKATDESTEYLSSDEFKTLLNTVKKEFDFIIIDTPPSSEMSDSSIIAQYADASIMVVRQDVVAIKHVLEAMNMFVYHRNNLLGCVLNCTSNDHSRYGHYYGRYGNK